MDYDIDLNKFGEVEIKLKLSRRELDMFTREVSNKDLYNFLISLDALAFELENEEK